MRELPAGKPDLVGLGVALVPVDEALTVGHHLHVRVDTTAANGDRTTQRRQLDPVDVVSPALFDHGVDALRVGAPNVGSDGERPARRRVDARSTSPPVCPLDETLTSPSPPVAMAGTS